MGPQISPVNEDLLTQSFVGRRWISVDGCILPERYQKFSDDIENFEVRDDDVWVCSFPKTGTTWTQEMVWCIANDLDFERAKTSILERFPFFESGSSLFERSDAVRKNPTIEVPGIHRDTRRYLDKSPSPRFIKTHLPFNLLPRQLRTRERKPRIVYVVRNAKDTCISYFHHSVLLHGFRGDFDDFVNLFLDDKLSYAPFSTNVLGYWEQQNHENVLFLKYEDMKKDLPSVIRRTAKFFNKNLTNDEVAVLNDHLSFASMQVNPAVNNEGLTSLVKKLSDDKNEGAFIRSGTTGQWKTVMTPEVIKRFDDWTDENLKDTDFPIISFYTTLFYQQ